jgi:hypothetical protein
MLHIYICHLCNFICSVCVLMKLLFIAYIVDTGQLACVIKGKVVPVLN